LLSMAVDYRRLRRRARADPSDTAIVPPKVLRTAAGVLLALMAFFSVAMLVANALALPVSAAISMLAPAVALGLHYVLSGPRRSMPVAWRALREDASYLRVFASEFMLFLVAG